MKSVLVLLAFIASAGCAHQNLGSDQDTPESLARVFFHAVTGGDVETAMSISGTPFAWDRKRMVNRDELRADYERVSAKKGARRTTITRTERLPGGSDPRTIQRHCGPTFKGDVVVVWFRGERRQRRLFCCVEEGRVVGFSD